jgi:hypothetical protein
MPTETWRTQLDLNVTSAFICTRIVGGEMVKRRSGRIVNVASISGLIANRGIAGRGYEAGKAALVAFTRAKDAVTGAVAAQRALASHTWPESVEVRVRMGFWFSATIPLRSITEAGRRGYVWAGYGVHFVPRGPWIVNGSGHNVVRIVIDPPVRARAVGVNVELRELWISLEDPDGFLAAIGH